MTNEEVRKLEADYEDLGKSLDMLESLQARMYGHRNIPLEEKDKLSNDLYMIRERLGKYYDEVTNKLWEHYYGKT